MTGCVAKNDFRVDKSFTAEECEDIRHVAGDWQIATGERLDLTFGADVDGDTTLPKREIIKAYSRSYIVRNIPNDPGNAMGYHTSQTFPGESIVVIVDRIHAEHDADYRAAFRSVLRHEIGHHYGAQHVGERGSVMYPSVNETNIQTECVDSFTVDSYCQNKDDCHREQLRGCAVAQ